MMTALLILGIIAVIVLISGLVLVAVTISQTLAKQADVLDRAHDRFISSLNPLFDRLMAHNWEEYLTLRSTEEEDEGGFLTPEEQSEGEEGGQVISNWGSLRNSFIPTHSADEEKLFAEDFTDDDEPVRRSPA